MQNSAAVALIFFLMLSSGTGTAKELRDITLDDYFTQAYITSVALSPDGKWVAYTEMRWEPPHETRNTDLWVVPASGGTPRRLTFDPTADTNPQWSADSRRIYFASSRGDDKLGAPNNGKSQVYRIAVDGGQEEAVTRIAEGIASFQLSHSGQALFYTVVSEETEDEWLELRKKHKDVEYGDGIIEATVLWKLNLNTWRSEKVFSEKRTIKSFDVSRDEQRIALITTPTEKLISNEGWSQVDILNLRSGAIETLEDSLWRELAPSPYGWLSNPSWSPDGTKLAFTITFDGYPAEIYVASWSQLGPQSQKLSRPDECSVESPAFRWSPDSRDLYAVVQLRACQRVLRFQNAGRPGEAGHQVLTPGELVVEQFDLSSNGQTLVANISDTTRPADIYAYSLASGKRQKLTEVNPQISEWKLPHIHRISWIGADGDSCEGLLELPPDYVPGTALPTLVCVHGGPTSADVLRFEYWIYGKILFSSRGWAVFSPNYRGSTGYGDKFMTDLIGRENDVEVQDILLGVDELVRRGIADSTKLAVSGWSNGGYLTNCLITTSDRFKAASSGAGVLDMATQWGTEDTPGHVINYMQGLPWEKPEALQKASPLYELHKVKTPTLIHVGAQDERVPASHSKALHRALHHYLGVPSELILYPGQGHGITKMNLRRAKMEWDIEWFKRYVTDPVPVTVPKAPQ